MWKRHIDHVRKDSMDRMVSDPGRESQVELPIVPLAVPLSKSVPNPSQVP